MPMLERVEIGGLFLPPGTSHKDNFCRRKQARRNKSRRPLSSVAIFVSLSGAMKGLQHASGKGHGWLTPQPLWTARHVQPGRAGLPSIRLSVEMGDRVMAVGARPDRYVLGAPAGCGCRWTCLERTGRCADQTVPIFFFFKFQFSEHHKRHQEWDLLAVTFVDDLCPL